MKHIKLNLGCGEKYLEGYINCDYIDTIKTDKIVDLNSYPYPFEDNSAEEILIDNVLEHLDDVVKFMSEAHRILRKKGLLRIYVPYGKSDGAIQDPTHKHFFLENSMNYFCSNFNYSYYSKKMFEMKKLKLFIGNQTIKSEIRKYIPFKSVLKKFLFNIYDGIYFEMQPIK